MLKLNLFHKVTIVAVIFVLFISGFFIVPKFLTKNKTENTEKGWIIENNNVYYKRTITNCSISMHCDTHEEKNKIEGADAKTFTIFNDIYAKDKNSVYVEDKKIENADAGTFEVLDNERYAKDKNQVYYAELYLLGMGGGYKPGLINGADAKTFTVLDYDYSKDANTVYCFNRVVRNADPKTFAVLKYGYAIDNNGVYYKDKLLSEADTKTFVVLDEPIESLDAKSFDSRIEKGLYHAEDDNRLYYQGKIVGNKK